MRKRKTFMLTVLTTEKGLADYCGQVKVVSSGKTCVFTSLDELNQLISVEMNNQTTADDTFGEIDFETSDSSRL